MAYLEEVLPALRKGKKIRRADWNTGDYIYIKKDNNLYDSYNELSIYDLNFIITKDDWEIYEEREKKEEFDWDYIIKNKCLCKFWDDNSKDTFFGCLENYEVGSKGLFFFKTDVVPAFDNCRPAEPEEIVFYKDKNK